MWGWTIGLYGVQIMWFFHTVRKVLPDFDVSDWWRCCEALCDEKFCQIGGNGHKFSHIASSVKFSNSAAQEFAKFEMWTSADKERSARIP